jgi:hypothetical protein
MELTAQAVELRAKNLSFNAIARELGITHPTAKKWIEDEYARRSEHRELDREKHLAVYEAIQSAAWAAFQDTNSASLNRSGYLNTIKAAEDSKVKITGAEAPHKYQDVTEESYEIVFDDDEIPTEVP